MLSQSPQHNHVRLHRFVIWFRDFLECTSNAQSKNIKHVAHSVTPRLTEKRKNAKLRKVEVMIQGITFVLYNYLEKQITSLVCVFVR